MKKNIYLILAVVGFVFPVYYLIQFYSTEPVADFWLAISNVSATNMGALLSFDLLISATAASLFITLEGLRIQMKYWWVFILLTLGIGLSFALPLFLYFRERHLEK